MATVRFWAGRARGRRTIRLRRPWRISIVGNRTGLMVRTETLGKRVVEQVAAGRLVDFAAEGSGAKGEAGNAVGTATQGNGVHG